MISLALVLVAAVALFVGSLPMLALAIVGLAMKLYPLVALAVVSVVVSWVFYQYWKWRSR